MVLSSPEVTHDSLGWSSRSALLGLLLWHIYFLPGGNTICLGHTFFTCLNSHLWPSATRARHQLKGNPLLHNLLVYVGLRTFLRRNGVFEVDNRFAYLFRCSIGITRSPCQSRSFRKSAMSSDSVSERWRNCPAECRLGCCIVKYPSHGSKLHQPVS